MSKLTDVKDQQIQSQKWTQLCLTSLQSLRQLLFLTPHSQGDGAKISALESEY